MLSFFTQKRNPRSTLIDTMSGPIVVRNLTAQPLTVKLVERYEAPKHEQVGGVNLANLTSNFTTLMSNATGSAPDPRAPTRPELGDAAQSFAQQDVDVRMEPFTRHDTQIKTSERGLDDVARLTVQGDGGGRWKIDVPTRSSAAERLSPLGPDPKHDYTGIYVKEHTLAIIEDCNPRAWMKEFKDDTQLSALSMPGTHNSPTHHTALPSVRCQAVSPREQLENGVRFFDIRVQPGKPEDPNSDDLNLVHGVFPISLTGPKKFRPLLDHVHEFLSQNPSETVVISLKREGPGNATDQQLR